MIAALALALVGLMLAVVGIGWGVYRAVQPCGEPGRVLL